MNLLYHNYQVHTRCTFEEGEEILHRFDSVLATVVRQTAKGVILQFERGQQGFAYGNFPNCTIVLASVQKIREDATPRLSIDSVISYPEAVA